MYFLTSAIEGMKRRWLATVLVAFGGVALLSASSAIGVWSYWLSQSNANLETQRTASAFLATTEDAAANQILSQVQKLPNIDSARLLGTEEFLGYLKSHFPTLAEMVAGLGNDVIPRLIEIKLSAELDASTRAEALAEVQSVPQILRVDDGAARVEQALNSLHWLSMSGSSLAIGLWIVLLIVCLGHYQSAIQAQSTEMNLLRSFGATKISLFIPWALEALFQAVLTGFLAVVVLLVLRLKLLTAYNDFFGTIGYEPLRWSFYYLPYAFIFTSGLAFIAHILGGSLAFVRSKVV